jgi:hypothetical protein
MFLDLGALRLPFEVILVPMRAPRNGLKVQNFGYPNKLMCAVKRVDSVCLLSESAPNLALVELK